MTRAAFFFELCTTRVFAPMSTAAPTLDAQPKSQPSRRKRILFAAFAVLLPIAGLTCLEGVARLAGYGGYAPTLLRVGDSPRGTVVITDKSGPASYFYSNRDRPGAIDENTFLSPKPPGTIRVVLSGESAMKGFPEPRAFSAGSFLQRMLEDLWPNKKVEIVNIGTTAISSFPMLEILTEALDYEPDLVVIYGGNNEFFGAYGVASLNRAGRSPTAMRLQRVVRSLGLVQWVTALFDKPKSREGKTLMEVMMAQSAIAPDDPLRADAASNLYANVSEMIRRCRVRNVPVIVCTLPANERDLAPLGAADLSRVPEGARARVQAAMESGLADAETRPAQAVLALQEVLKAAPNLAHAHFALGRAKFALGDKAGASAEFQAAINLDPMPWRAPAAENDSLRRATSEQGAALCDLQQAFRDASPGGCIGWELMDDHVHPTLAGQALVARAIVRTLVGMKGSLAVDPAAVAKLPDDETYARQLGDNIYDRYGVAHTVRILCAIPFFASSNPGALSRFDALVKELQSQMPASALTAAQEWQKPQLHRTGQQRPISGVVARAFVRDGDFAKAEPLFDVATRCVPPFSDWNLEYTYFLLASREKLRGRLSDEDRRIGLDAIDRGKFLRVHGRGQSGMVDRHIGRLYQLVGDFASSIPHLRAAREQLSGMDRVAADAALFDAYIRTGNTAAARELAQDGVTNSGEYSRFYVQMMERLSSATSRPAA